jgi:hypothetical protein
MANECLKQSALIFLFGLGHDGSPALSADGTVSLTAAAAEHEKTLLDQSGTVRGRCCIGVVGRYEKRWPHVSCVGGGKGDGVSVGGGRGGGGGPLQPRPLSQEWEKIQDVFATSFLGKSALSLFCAHPAALGPRSSIHTGWW